MADRSGPPAGPLARGHVQIPVQWTGGQGWLRPATRDRLNRLAQEEHLSAADMIDRLVEHAEQERLLKTMNDDFQRLRGNESAWAEFKAETAAWDATSADVGADA